MKLFQYAAVTFLLIVASGGQLGAQGSSEGTIKVENPWSRATPAGSKTGVIYMTLVNVGTNADRLLGGTTPVAETVMFHSSINDNGIMKMRELTAIDLAPGAKVALKPSGTHVMLVGLRQPLKEGRSFPLTLQFEKAGKVDVTVSVGKFGDVEHHKMDGM
jgi:periplasmic copper chaperone A